jgi:phosphatidylinositol alpha-1,6-mannosyltransferase
MVHAACCLPEGFLAWLLRRRLGIPYLVYVHGEELNVARTSRELTWMMRRALWNAELVVANSGNTARLLQAGWPISRDRLHVLHPGVDTRQFRPVPRDLNVRRQLGWNDRPVVLTVGRLQRRKGHDQVIRSLPAIRKAVPDVLYAIVGDGQERRRLEAVVDELELRGNVLFHGELHSDKLLCAYQQCDLFALPNQDVAGDIEGFGIVLLEAQSCGKPVVAGQSGGTAETMNSPVTGIVINSADIPSLAATIQDLLLNDQRRQRMGSAARTWVVERFDWNVQCPVAASIFQKASSSSLTRVPETANPQLVS